MQTKQEGLKKTNQARSANASDSVVASCAIPLELANLEPEDAKKLGIDRTLNPRGQF